MYHLQGMTRVLIVFYGQRGVYCMAVNSDEPKLSNPEAPAGLLLETEDIVQQELNCS